jgi:hypothetical protein
MILLLKEEEESTLIKFTQMVNVTNHRLIIDEGTGANTA